MSQLIIFAIYGLFFYFIGKLITKKHHKGFSKGKKKLKNKASRKNKSFVSMAIDKYVEHKDDNQLPDGRIILESNEPGTLPPLPRYPIVGRAAKPAVKTNRRLSPWGGTIDSDEDYDV